MIFCKFSNTISVRLYLVIAMPLSPAALALLLLLLHRPETHAPITVELCLPLFLPSLPPGYAVHPLCPVGIPQYHMHSLVPVPSMFPISCANFGLCFNANANLISFFIMCTRLSFSVVHISL